MKRLIKKANQNLYHGTCYEYLKSITNDGALKPNQSTGAGKNKNYDGSNFGGFVFLATTLQVALNFANYIPPQQTEAHVVIELTVNEDRLLPDNDDDPDAQTWQDSASKLQQVKVDGDIPSSTFSKIYFYDRYTGELMFETAFNGWEQVYESNREKFELGLVY